MTPDKVIVTIAGFAAIAFIAWFFWMKKPVGVKAGVGAGGVQEVAILVKGGYNPDVIVVEHGRPVRLDFHREETAACSDTVVLPDFNKSVRLPAWETTSIEVTPEKPGEYEFVCGMRMLRGKLIAE